MAAAADEDEAHDDTPHAPGTQRIDKWLWFARITKSRTLAAQLVGEGKVAVEIEGSIVPGGIVVHHELEELVGGGEGEAECFRRITGHREGGAGDERRAVGDGHRQEGIRIEARRLRPDEHASFGLHEVEAIAELNRFATAGLVPDRTLYLRVDPALGRERQGVRAQAADRLEQEGETFFGAVALVYEDLAALEPDRIRTIDAAQDPATVLADAIGAISDLLG